MTLFQTGVIDHLRSGRYQFFVRWAPGLSQEQREDCFEASFSCDAYLCSSNAITENGELYNVDGHSNRIAALALAPHPWLLSRAATSFTRPCRRCTRTFHCGAKKL